MQGLFATNAGNIQSNISLNQNSFTTGIKPSSS